MPRALMKCLLVVAIAGCSGTDNSQPLEANKHADSSQAAPITENPVDGEAEQPRLKWAIAIHGGAGKPPRGLPPEKLDEFKQAVVKTLTEALTLGQDMLAEGRSAVETVEQVVRVLEDDPNFNAGRGSVLNIEGTFELHASIMDGDSRDGGAVAAVDTIANPITAARLVMSETDHVLLVGEGAERFAAEHGLEAVEPDYFRTQLRHNNWLRARQEFDESKVGRIGNPSNDGDDMIGTVGCVALDQQGNLAAATSTGGVAHKRFGRMGDSSILGAGNYADNRTCAVSCTGIGEYFIRNAVAFQIHALVRYKDWPLEQAVRHVIDEELKDGSGGLIAVDRHGTIFMHYNRDGMRRAAADSTGRFQVEYWK